MANNGNGDNSNDPLRQYLISPRLNQPPSLFPLPEEHNDVTIPMPLTPSEFKNRLIFGPFSQNPSSSSSNSTDLLLPPLEPNVPAREPESTHRLHRSKTAPAMAAINDISHSNDQAEVSDISQPSDQRTEQSDSKSIVRQAVALLVTYLSLGVLNYWLNRDSYNVNPTHPLVVALYFSAVTVCGVLIMRFAEKIGWLDSFYFSVMLATTVGYGDRAFSTLLGRLLAGIWLLVSTLAVARAFLYLAEARVDKRNRERAKKVLGEDMSISQFFAADIDHNGCVSKAEYVIYKLKQMEKVTQKDMLLICNQFDKLDGTNSGRITLVDLLEIG